MPSNTASAIYQPPSVVQEGNLPVFADGTIQANFLEALAFHDGNISAAAGMIGVSRAMVYRHMARENLFREQIGVVQQLAMQGRAQELLHGTYDHLRSHIRDGWEYQRDEDGNLVVDDDFEPIRRSALSIKSLEGLAREMRQATQGDDGQTRIAIQNINRAEAKAEVDEPRARPTLATGDVIDAEAADILAEIDQEQAQ